jgi:hypothetical protein
MRTASKTANPAKNSDQSVIMLRLAGRLVERLDRIAQDLGKSERNHGRAHKVGRSTVMREAGLLGLPMIEFKLSEGKYSPPLYSPRTDSKPAVVMFRITSELVETLNRLATKLVKQDRKDDRARRVGRATVMFEAMMVGLPLLEVKLRDVPN